MQEYILVYGQIQLNAFIKFITLLPLSSMLNSYNICLYLNIHLLMLLTINSVLNCYLQELQKNL